DAALGTVSYLMFYSVGFFIPYYLLTGIFLVRYAPEPKDELAFDKGYTYFSIAVISLACFLTFIIFLRSIIAFIRNFPSDVFNGWLFIFWCVSSFFLLLAGFSGLKREINKIHIKVRHNSEIFCRCAKCGNEWSFPAEDLLTRNIVFR